MKTVCPKCGGARLRPRTKEEDGNEADIDLHPVLSKQPKPCERCGGGGMVDLTPEEIKAKVKDAT